MNGEYLVTLFKGVDPVADPDSMAVVRRSGLVDQVAPSTAWLGWLGSLALTVGGETGVDALWRMDAIVNQEVTKYHILHRTEILENVDLGSGKLWQEIRYRLRVTPYLDRQLARYTESDQLSEPVRRLAKSVYKKVWSPSTDRGQLTEKSRRIKTVSEREGRLQHHWSQIDRDGLGWKGVKGEHALRIALKKQPMEAERKKIYMALHCDNSQKSKLWRSLHHNRQVGMQLSNASWTEKRESLWNFEGLGVLDLRKLAIEVSTIGSRFGVARGEAQSLLGLADTRFAWNIPYLRDKLESGGVKLTQVIDFDAVFWRVMEMMGMQDYYDQYALVTQTKTLDRAIPLDPPRVVGLNIDERTGLHAVLDKVHELGHFMEMTLTNVMLPGGLRLNSMERVGTEIVAMLLQIGAYSELGDGALSDLGVEFDDGKARGLERLMIALTGSLSIIEFEEGIYEKGFTWDIDKVSDIDARVKRKYGITQFHPTEWANDMRGVWYRGYDLNYIYAIVGGMQLYDYARRNFGGLFNLDAHLWLADNFCQYGGAMKWRDKVKQATGEELNPDYLINALNEVDWKVYFSKRAEQARIS